MHTGLLTREAFAVGLVSAIQEKMSAKGTCLLQPRVLTSGSL